MDKKFAVAIGIIVVLALVLVYVLFIGPTIQGFVVQKQVAAQKIAVQTIMQVVNQQGYVVLGEGNDTMILVRYQQPQSTTNSSLGS
ncbi:MAG: hypothetical protein WC781_01545 [Candidatus Pacearchaeota archaeon]|jgi:predicted Kef-type K+ transport protein